MGPRHIVPGDRLCAGQLRIEIDGTPYFVGIVRIVENITELAFRKNIKRWKVGDIWSDLTIFWGPTVGILTKNYSEKSNAKHMPGIPPRA